MFIWHSSFNEHLLGESLLSICVDLFSGGVVDKSQHSINDVNNSILCGDVTLQDLGSYSTTTNKDWKTEINTELTTMDKDWKTETNT